MKRYGITVGDNIKLNVRLVDCVGYLVNNAIGYFLYASPIVPYNSFGSVKPICQRIAYFSSLVNFMYSVIIITDFSPCPYGIVSSTA